MVNSAIKWVTRLRSNSNGRIRFAPADKKAKRKLFDAGFGEQSSLRYIEDFCNALRASNQQEGEIGVLIDHMDVRQALDPCACSSFRVKG